MRSLRLVCKVRRKKRCNSYQGEQGVVAPNLLKRQFETDAPNQKWVTDVTEFRVGDRKLYLSPVMDLFDRQIISYAIGPSPQSGAESRSGGNQWVASAGTDSNRDVRTSTPRARNGFRSPGSGCAGARHCNFPSRSASSVQTVFVMCQSSPAIR